MEHLKIDISYRFIYGFNIYYEYAIEIENTNYIKKYGPFRQVKNIIYDKFKLNFFEDSIYKLQKYGTYYSWLNDTLFVTEDEKYQVCWCETKEGKINIYLPRKSLWRISDTTEFMQQNSIAQPKPRKYKF